MAAPRMHPLSTYGSAMHPFVAPAGRPSDGCALSLLRSSGAQARMLQLPACTYLAEESVWIAQQQHAWNSKVVASELVDFW